MNKLKSGADHVVIKSSWKSQDKLQLVGNYFESIWKYKTSHMCQSDAVFDC